MSKKKKTPAGDCVPRIFKNPVVPIFLLFLLNAIALGAAAALRNTAMTAAVYTCSETGVTRITPVDRFGGAALAVLLVAAAGVTAFLIIGTVVRANRSGVFPAGGIILDLALLAATVGIMVFSLNFARGEQPTASQFIVYQDEQSRRYYLVEEQFSKRNTLSIYLGDDEDNAQLITNAVLWQMSEDIGERYNISGMGDNIIIGFNDMNTLGAMTYREIFFTLPEGN